MGSNYFRIYLLTLLLESAVGQIQKSSLTFVIDNTRSMHDDIVQVKYGVNLIFDTVVNSNASQIENFILVTFSDPNVQFRTVTKDRNVFKNTLESITLEGNWDCPEMAMAGIELALTQSLPGSFLYVLTDASAKDDHLLEKVQNLALTKMSQIVFLLTGRCNDNDNDPQYQAYHKLAEATNGQVFPMTKSNIGEILKYVADSLTSRKTVVMKKTFPPGYDHNMTIPVDADMREVVIAGSGVEPNIDITAPDGSKPHAEHLVDIPRVVAVKINDTMPGNYTAKVGSKSETSVVVTATTTIQFKHGFSTFEPSSIDDTSTKPLPDQESHLSVQLVTTEDDAVLDKVVLTDLKDNVVAEFPLKLIDAKQKLYDTALFVPPNSLFKITVKGYDNKSKSPFTRTCPTPTEPQKPFLVISEARAPTITIEGGSTINAEYNESLTLSCKVNGFPKPDAMWLNTDDSVLPSDYSTLELPYDFINVLKIDSVRNNATYKCKAANSHGDVTKIVEVKTVKKKYFDVIEVPKDITIKYKHSSQVTCKVDADPPAKITWLKNGKELHSDEFIDILPDVSVLTIKDMRKHLEGTFECKAKSDTHERQFIFNVTISGVEPTTSITGPSVVNAEFNEPLFLRCHVTGYPKPNILWTDEKSGEVIRSAPVAVATPYDYGQEMQMDKVNKNATYKCTAKNDHGEHSSTVQVVTVQKIHFDIIEKPKDTKIRYQEEGHIFCKIDAYPPAVIQWKFKGKPIINDDHYEISSNGSSLKINDMQPNLKGYYSCRVDHDETNTLKTFNFKVKISGTVKPEIDKSEDQLIVKEGTSVDINCRIIKGIPPPTFTWEFQSDNDNRFRQLKDTSSTIHIENVTRYDSGSWRCIANNNAGQWDYFTVGLTVQSEPKIVNAVKHVDSKDGDKITLPCKVEGYPPPTVIWSLNGAVLSHSAEYIHRNNSLSFSASLENNGIFTCTATNEFGRASVETKVDYYKEVEFVTPRETSFKTSVGKSITLRCEAYGYPAPTITWQFYSPENEKDKPATKLKVLRTADSPDELVIKFTSTNQEGAYFCSASNKKSKKMLAFEVNVTEPAHIIPNEASKRPIKAVKGDLVRIPCQAVGKPKPYVTWVKNGVNIPTGYDYYSIDTDGALLIEGIKEGGSYRCYASNDLGGPASIAFLVALKNYPSPTQIVDTYTIKVDESAAVECPIPHTPMDVVHWYRDSEKKASGELKFSRVTHSDAGVYTCRVSNRTTFKSESRSVKIVVIPYY